MSKYILSAHKQFEENFLNDTKKLLKSNISTNPDTLNRQLQEIVESFNDYISYLAQFYDDSSEISKNETLEEVKFSREKLIRSFGVLRIQNTLPSKFFEIIEFKTLRRETIENLNEEELNQLVSTQKRGDLDDTSPNQVAIFHEVLPIGFKIFSLLLQSK